MTALDNRLRATAQRLLDRFGMAAQYEATTGADYDANSLDAATGTTTVTPVKSFIYDASVEEIASGVVERGQCIALVAGASLPSMAKPGDRIVFPHETVTVMKPMAIWSGEQVALWQLAVLR